MRKKIVLIAIMFVAFFTTTNVFAVVITCNYGGDYVLEFDTLYYDKSWNDDGYCNQVPLCLYNKNKPYNKNKRGYFFRLGDGSEKWQDVKSEKDCPKEIYLLANLNEAGYIIVRDEESVEKYEYAELEIHSFIPSKKVSCGNITDIPKKIPELTSYAITIVQIAIPVILVIMGSIDLFKGITAQKEDEIKKGQQIFIKRLVVAALIFFVVVVVKLLISVIDQSSKDNISSCIDCFISNDCD